MRTPEPPQWSVVTDGWGRVTVADDRGVPVLKHPDPVTQIEHAYLVAQAPALRASVAAVIRRLERIEVDHGIELHSRDAQIISQAWLALHDCTPPEAEYVLAEQSRNQLELDFEDVA